MRHLFALLLFISSQAFASEALLLEIRGTINPATAHYLDRAVNEAHALKADFILVELDTPGGLVSSVREMAQTIDKSTVPVVVYTTPAGASATSAGAILMISSHVGAMAPGTNIGAAHPVGAQGEDIKGAMAEKAVNDISAFARSMAELRDRNPIAAAEVVSKSRSYTAHEAQKENLIEIIATDRSELLKLLDGGTVLVNGTKEKITTAPAAPALIPYKMTIGEKLLHYVSHPNIAAILMTLGILFIYAEMSAPGLGLPGIAGAMCLIVAFIAFQALPIQTGGLVLLIIGVLLILAEVFVGSGMLALGGSAALILGLLWLIDPQATDLQISPVLIGSLAAFLFLSFLLIFYTVARFKRQNATALSAAGDKHIVGLSSYQGSVASIEPGGLAGYVKIRGELWKFVSPSPVRENQAVRVIRSRGLELEVEPEKE